MPLPRAFLVAVTCLALTAVAAAQDAYVYEPFEEVDEFTGAYMCYQRVDVSLEERTGLGLVRFEEGYGVILARDTTWDDPAFNLFQDDALQGDLVYVRFGPDDVRNYVPIGVDVDRELEEEWVLLDAPGLAQRIMDTTGPLRVRFDGSNATRDFTLTGDAVRTVGREFERACR